MSKKKLRVLEDIKEIRAFNDPYRQQILREMFMMGKPATAKEIANAMNEAPSKVNYHMKVLEEHGFVELDHTENIKGIIAKYYVCADNEFEVKLSKDEVTGEESNAVLDMLDSIYTDAKNTHMKKLKKIAEEAEKDREAGYVISSKMYLSKEELEELKNLVRKFSENKKDGRELVDFFISII